MALFAEVLGKVRLFLTWAPPADIQALLDGLVAEQIISEGYRQNLKLCRFNKGIPDKPGDREPNSLLSQGSTTLHLSRKEINGLMSGSSGDLENIKKSMSPLHMSQDFHSSNPKLMQELMEEKEKHLNSLNHVFYPTLANCQHSLRFSDEIQGLLSGDKLVLKPGNDSERDKKGNSENGEEWLEQVEEAARRIAVPLWQNWHKGQNMLLSLIPCETTGCAISDSIVSDRERQHPFLDMEEETELEAACKPLDGIFNCTSLGIRDLCLSNTLQLGELYSSAAGRAAGLNIDTRELEEEDGTASPVEACQATETKDITENPWNLSQADRPTDAMDAQRRTKYALSESFCGDLLYLLKDFENTMQENSYLHPGMKESLDCCRNEDNASLWSTDRAVFENIKSHQDAKMQEGDQDNFIQSDILPEDLSEFLNDDFLVSFLDPNALDKAFSSINVDDISQQSQPKPQEPHAETPFPQRGDAESGSSPEDGGTDFADTPPKVLRLYPPQAATPLPIQFIAIPDNSGYQLVQLPPPNSSVIRLPLPNTPTTPTYILVPVDSPPCNHHIPPLSPVDGTVAPILLSSSPPGSLSDTASKATSPSCVSLRSPSHDRSPSKEPPQSPRIPDISQRVKDYIQAAKFHMYQQSLEMEEGLSITFHYVDQHVSQREIYRSGKNTSKCSDKEFAITGRTQRQKNLLQLNQIFESSNVGKSVRCILLLGNAGMGKTTLIKKLCLDWSRNSLPQFDFVFLLDGKGLTLTEPIYSLQTLLFDLSSVAPCVDPNEVFAQVLADPKRVLLIFDGFNELRDYESLLQTQEKDCFTLLQKDSKTQTFTVRQLYSAIFQRLLLPGCTLLLSSRPRGAASQLLRRVDTLLEVCGFTSDSIESYIFHYFTDPALRASALDCLKSSSYLYHLCWNPGLCRLACMVLEQSRNSENLPRTLTELCHQVVSLKMQKHAKTPTVCGSTQTQTTTQSTQNSPTEHSKTSQERIWRKTSPNKTRGRVSTVPRMQKSRKAKELGKQEHNKNGYNLSKDADESENKDLLLQLSALAWEGVKSNSSTIPRDRSVPTEVKAFGLGLGVLWPQNLERRRRFSNGETDNRNEKERRVEGQSEKNGEDVSTADCKDLILAWTSPFLQSYLAAVHLSLSRIVSDRSFLQALPFQMGTKWRRRPKREELELTQRIVVGLLFHKKKKLQLLHSHTETVFRNTLISRQGLVAKHLAGLSYSDLGSAQVLELCHYVYEASVSQESSGRDPGGTKLATQLAENLPESLRFNGVPLSPPDVFTIKNALLTGAAEGRSFCLDFENTGIQISGLRALVSLNNINSFRACIADVINLWEQLEQSGEEELLQGAVSKFHIQPLKATQVCHIEHLEKLVNIHTNKRLSESSRLSDSILTDGVPAVKDLHKLEFELGSEEGPLALPKLWNLLPGLHNLQHLDLEESKIEDQGAEKLASILHSLTSLEVLNLSQNCIGDKGVKKLAHALKDLPKLHCLSLYSNDISDEGAESLAAVLPHMPSLTHLDLGYNKLRDVGAQSLALSLRNCKKVKTLRMWNQCIPYRVLERLQRQDSRILSL
ncbi:uncharacterized protein ciita isoform X3 [Oryzias latipes]